MTIPSGPFCAALGCSGYADVYIELDDGRKRPVCNSHADDGEVIDHV